MIPPSPADRQSAELGRGENLTQIVVWNTLRKHWPTAAFTALAVSLGAIFFTLGSTKIYQSTATISFDPNPPRPLGTKIDTVVDMGVGSYFNNQEFYETQYKIIESSRVVGAVVADLGLHKDAAFLDNIPPGRSTQPRSVPEDVATELLKTRLKIEPVKNSRLANVKVEDADPERAQRILSTLVDTYTTQNLDDALASTTSAVDWLTGQLEKLKGDLESSEMALHTYKKDKNILSVAFDDQTNLLREQMRLIDAELTRVRTRHEEIAARRTELAHVQASNPTDLAASEFLQSPTLQGLRQRYEDAVRDRDSLVGSGKGEKHPDVEAAQRRLDASRAALLTEVKNIRGALDRDLAVIQHQEGGLSGLFERAKTQALDLNLLEIEYNRLHRTKENNEKLYAMVLERTKESDLTRMLRVNNIHVIDRPSMPRQAVRPRRALNIGVGIVVGLILGVAAALGRALLDRTVKTPDDVEQALGKTFLGLIPEMDATSAKSVYYGRRRGKESKLSGSHELMVHEHPSSGIAEASRAVRTNLLFMAPDNPLRKLLITSAGPSEGKTTVACCVAIAMAQAGQRVVLIDCDLRRPRIHRIFRQSSDTGVTTALLDGEIDDAIKATHVPNLSIIPAGPLPPNPAELLHSDRFKAFLARVAAKFDRVIIDSPPIVPVTDAAIISTAVDGTMLVVRAFTTRKDMARHALRALTDVGALITGVVLNAVNLDRHEYKYAYYYYRRDDYKYTSRVEDQSSASAPTPPQSH